MYTYAAYNLGITSEMPLPEFVPAGAGGDLIVRVGPSIHVDEAEFRFDQQEILLVVPNVARFILRDGKEIIVHPHPDGDPEMIRRFIIGTVMGLALSQRGNLVMHASSVETNGKAIAFVGSAGKGKSTMALAMVARGCKFITDDVCAIIKLDGRLCIPPGYPLARVSQEAADRIPLPRGNITLVSEFEDKLEVQLDGIVSKGPVPVSRIYLLDDHGGSGLERIGPQNAILEILKNTLPTRFGHPGDKAHFLKCVELVQNIPVFRLSRTNSLDDLSESAQKIEEHLSSA